MFAFLSDVNTSDRKNYTLSFSIFECTYVHTKCTYFWMYILLTITINVLWTGPDDKGYIISAKVYVIYQEMFTYSPINTKHNGTQVLWITNKFQTTNKSQK